MLRSLSMLASLSLTGALSCAALAQPAPATQPGATSAATPDAATLKAARDVVVQMQGDRAATLASMSTPLIGMMQQMGIKEPDRAQVLVGEVLIPFLTAHYDELLDIQAHGFAAALSKEDLQTIGAFYASPTGKRLVAAQPKLVQVQMAGMSQWMGKLAPEMQAKLVAAVKAHGWATPAK